MSTCFFGDGVARPAIAYGRYSFRRGPRVMMGAWRSLKSARSSTSTWTPSTRRSSSAMIPSLRGRPVAVGGRAARRRRWRPATRRASSACARPCRRSTALAAVRRAGVRAAALRRLQGSVARRSARSSPEYTPLVEPLSLDEAYLDVTTNLHGIPLGLATRRARSAHASSSETGLTASAGISYNKFLAKLASDHRKPNGQFVITPEMGPAFVEEPGGGEIPWRRPGDGRQDERLGIHTGADLKAQSLDFLQAAFRQVRRLLSRHRAGRGRAPGRARPAAQVVGSETTFMEDLGRPAGDRRWRAVGARRCLELLRAHRHGRPHRDGEGEVRRLPDHHPQPHPRPSGQQPRRAGADQRRAGTADLSAGEAGAAARRVAVEHGDARRRAGTGASLRSGCNCSSLSVARGGVHVVRQRRGHEQVQTG